MENQINNSLTDSKIISIHDSIAARTSILKDSQKTYREYYLTLVNFLMQLKNTDINYDYIPTPPDAAYDYVQKAKDCHGAIDSIIENYANNLSNKLENLPNAICASLSQIYSLSKDASDCAARLNNGSSADVEKDIDSILYALHVSYKLIQSSVITEYKALLVSLENFFNGNEKSGDLFEVEAQLNGLVKVFTDSSNYYTYDMTLLQKDIDTLNREINSLNKMVAGGAITMGSSVFIGASSIALLIASGAGAPVAIIAGIAAGVFFTVGAVITADAIIKLNTAQKAISEKSANLHRDQIAIVQMDNYNMTYSNFVKGIEDVKTSVTEIENAWLALANDLESLEEYIEQGAKDTLTINVNWGLVKNDLDSISEAADKIKVEVAKLNVADVQVSDGNFDFTMDEKQLTSEFEKSHKIGVTIYLKTA